MACSPVQALQNFIRSPFQLTTPRAFLPNTHDVSFFFTTDSSTPTLKCGSVDSGKRLRSKSRNRRLSLLFASSEGVEGIGLGEEKENPQEIITGEWPENYSLLNYDDLRAFLEPEIFKDKVDPSTLLGEVMTAIIRTATVDQTLEEINHHFETVSGIPVIDEQFKCIGVVSKKDRQRASNGLQSRVSEVMSSPAITLSPEKTVLEAAALMLKEKIHRIPIVNEGGQVVGMVTRTDIFRALEGLPT